MLNILICCGGGFSSSYVTQRMDREIEKRKLENEYKIDFSPFSLMTEVMDQYDVILLCPHLKMGLYQLLKETEIDKPIYLLPPRVYGMMQLDTIISDSKDVISYYQEKHTVPVIFPHEENLLKIRRTKSYREVYGDYHDQEGKK